MANQDDTQEHSDAAAPNNEHKSRSANNINKQGISTASVRDTNVLIIDKRHKQAQAEKTEETLTVLSLIMAGNTRNKDYFKTPRFMIQLFFIPFNIQSLAFLLLATTMDEFWNKYWWSTLRQVVWLAFSLGMMVTDIQIAFGEGFEAGLINNPVF